MTQDREIVVVEQFSASNCRGLGHFVGIQRIHRGRVGLEGHPAHGSVAARAGQRMVLFGGQPKVGCFDAQRCIV